MMPTRRRFLKIVAAQSATLFAASQMPLLGRASTNKLTQWRGIVLGAEATIQLHCKDATEGKAVLEKCVSEIQRLERIFSLYDEQSSLSRLNQTKQLQHAPNELIDLIATSKQFGSATNGVFDITIHPLIKSYRAHFKNEGQGLPEGLDEILKSVDYRKVELFGSRIRLQHPQAAITLNGIAQGYITDKIAELLLANGIGHTLIDLGEKRALGPHPTGRAWNLGLANRFGVHNVVELDNRSLSSSGGYGTIFDSSGKHHHLIDPRTGLSVNHHASVHVVADSATTADALSTALATCSLDETASIEAKFPQAHVFRS
ncbi:ApbE family [Verrucomicrobiia bacterium DG1235]|nr:ApbE family [Verrucomicrobiae bacterium DG1235]